MARTLAYFRPSSPERHCRGRGFTLLELLVVLLLVSLVTGLVAPSMIDGLAAARERGVAAEASAVLEGLPLRAFRAGVEQSYDGADLTQMLTDVPDGWSLAVQTPLRYSETGVAAGGDVLLVAPGRPSVRFRVLAVSGEVLRPQFAP